MSHAHRSLAALALVVAACSSSGGHGDADTDDATETDGATITIGDGDGDSGGDDGDVPGASCDAPIPRALRLLTRREYEATVLALVPLDDAADPGDAGDACEADADCDLSRESCTAGSCQADPCPLHTFVLDDPGHAHASVHVAGSFNGWPASVADGGWALEYVDAAGAWVTKRALEDGTHTYKFVVDGAWQPDPGNPMSEPDGFGGVNSLLPVDCAGAEPPPVPGDPDAHPAADFPVESRVTGFPFDNGVASGLVTSVHVEQYLRAAASIALRVTGDLPRHVGCDPAAPGCLSQFVTTFGRRALRRPLTDDEIATYVAVGEAQADPTTGVAAIVRVLLSSPYFLYRFELGQPTEDGAFALDAYEVAGILAFSLWGQAPDDALLEAAATGELDDAADIAARASAMLDDPKATAVLGDFAAQWLDVEHTAALTKNGAEFGAFDAELGAAMLAETRALLVRLVTADAGRYADLLTSPTTEVSPALAELYGVELDAPGSIAVPASRRAGILGHASVLARQAHSDRTSPVRRGVFVLERLLCQPPPPPPADVPSIPDVQGGQTARDVLEQHTADPACASCHGLIDPIGLGFEHFDAIGRRRDDDHGATIDARGVVRELDGTDVAFDGVPELAAVLADSEAAPACFATQVLRFVAGALEGPESECRNDALIEDFAAHDHDLRALLVATVQSYATAPRQAP